MVGQPFARIISRLVRPAFLVPIVLALGVAGCDFVDEILEVEVPGEVIAEDLDDPRHAGLLARSVVADFECAFGGYVVAAGTLGDELADAAFFASYWPVDRREVGQEGGPVATQTCDGGSVFPGIYTSLQTARFQGDELAEKLQEWTDAQVPDRDSLLATSYAYAGYAVLLLAESYCSIAIDRGPELTRSQAFGEAERRFTAALSAAQAAGADDIREMALLGRARARLNLAVVDGSVVDEAKLAEASSDAQQVTPGFVKYARFAATPERRRNQVYNANNLQRAFTVEEDFRDVTHAGVEDPRVPVVNTGETGVDALTPIWNQTKYPSLDSPIPIARYAEARLIVAEAELQRGNSGRAVEVIDALHRAAGLAPYPGGTPEEIRAHLIEERASELFLEGHHLGDRLRYGLPFTPAPGTDWHKGGRYGDTRCLPLPVQEIQDNPNLGG